MSDEYTVLSLRLVVVSYSVRTTNPLIFVTAFCYG